MRSIRIIQTTTKMESQSSMSQDLERVRAAMDCVPMAVPQNSPVVGDIECDCGCMSEEYEVLPGGLLYESASVKCVECVVNRLNAFSCSMHLSCMKYTFAKCAMSEFDVLIAEAVELVRNLNRNFVESVVRVPKFSLTKPRMLVLLRESRAELRRLKDAATKHVPMLKRSVVFHAIYLADSAISRIAALWNEIVPYTDWTKEVPERVNRRLQRREAFRQMSVVETDVEEQMDSAEAILSQTAKEGMGAVGSAVKGLFGLPSHRDSPSLVDSAGSDMSVLDVPHNVKSLSVHRSYGVGNHASVVDMVEDRECSILKRCQVPSLLDGSISWTNSASSGSIVYSTFVTPSLFEYVNPSGFCIPTALSYFSQFFKYWRGELVYTIEVVATRIHQGQLFVAYIPGNASDTIPTIQQAANCYSASIDLSQSNRTSIVVPYVSAFDYRKLTPGNELFYSPITADYLDPQDATGSLIVYVQNPLVAPPAVSSGVYVNIYVQAGENFEFAVPVTSTLGIQVDGVLQGDEVIANEDVANTSEEPSAIEIVNPLDSVVNWKTAETENIVGREYLLQANACQWTTAAPVSVIYNSIFPENLTADVNLAISGLLQYHYVYRFGCEFTLRFAASAFYQGVGVLAYDPTASFTTNNLSTVFQLPHAMINLAYETTVTLRVPWTNFVRAGVTDRTMNNGAIIFIPINPLLTPAGAAGTIHGSMWVKPLVPYVGVKRVVGTIQGDGPSDTGDAKVAPERAWPISRALQKGFMGNHMSIIDLLKRPELAYNCPSLTGGTVFFNNTAIAASLLQGPTHRKMMATYAFWCGGLRAKCVTEVSMSSNALIRVYPLFEYDGHVTTPITVGGANIYSTSFNGTQVWRPGMEPHLEISLPYFSSTPLKRTTGNASWPYVDIGPVCFDLASTTDPLTQGLVKVYLWCSVADDFSLHFPLYMPTMSILSVPNDASVNVVPVSATEQGGRRVVSAACCCDWTCEALEGAYMGIDMRIDSYCPLCARRHHRSGERHFRMCIEHRDWIRKKKADFEKDLTREGVEANPGPEPEVDCCCRHVRDWRNIVVRVVHCPFCVVVHDIHIEFGSCEFELCGIHQWVRDLTFEGVEPNPGPSFSKFFNFGYTTDSSSVDDAVRERVVAEVNEMLDQAVKAGPTGLKSIARQCVDYVMKSAAAPHVEALQVNVNEACESFTDRLMPALIWICDVILNLYIIFSAESIAAKSMAAVSLSAKIYVAAVEGKRLLKKLNEVIENPLTLLGFDSVEQGDESEWNVADMFDKLSDGQRVGIITAIASFLIAGVVTFVGSNVTNNHSRRVGKWSVASVLPDVMSDMSKVNNGVKGTFQMWTACKGVVTRVIDWFVKGDSLFADWYEDIKPRVKTWIAEWDDLRVSGGLETKRLYERKNGVNNYDRLCKLVPLAKEIREKGPLIKFFPMTYLRVAEEILTRVADCNEKIRDAVNRVEPVGVCIYGAAGCGKSYLTSSLLPAIVLRKVGILKDAAELKNMLYSMPRDPKQNFMDGYKTQPWVIIDDFGQSTDNEDFLSIINYISCTLCPVNMANMADKNAMFDSAFVVCSTNRGKFTNASTVTDISAVLRRFPVNIRLSCPGGGKFNVAGFTADVRAAVDKSAESVDAIFARYATIEEWTFDPASKTQAAGAAMSLSKLANTIAEIYMSRLTNYAATDDVVNTLIDNVASLTPDSPIILQGDDDTVPKTVESDPPKSRSPIVDFSDLTAKFAKLRDGTEVPLNFSFDAVHDSIPLSCEYDAEGYPRTFKTRSGNNIMYGIQQMSVTGGDDFPHFCGHVIAALANAEGEHRKALIIAFRKELSDNASRWGVNGAVGLAMTEPVVFHLLNERVDGFLPSCKFEWVGFITVWTTRFAVVALSAVFYYSLYKIVRTIACRLFDYFFAKEEQGPAYDKQVRRELKPNVVKTRGVVFQGDLSDRELALIHNTVRVQVRDSKDNVWGLNALCVDSRHILVPYHFFRYWSEKFVVDECAKCEIAFVDRAGKFVDFKPFSLSVTNSTRLMTPGPLNRVPTDLMLVRFVGVNMNHMRCVSHFFATDRLWYGMLGSSKAIRLLGAEDGGTKGTTKLLDLMSCRSGMTLPYSLDVSTVAGDCGRVCVLADSTSTTPVLGFHVAKCASFQGTFLYSPISAESYKDAISCLDSVIKPVVPVVECSLEGVDFHGGPNRFHDSGMDNHGKATYRGEDLCRFPPDKTDLCRTDIKHPDWEDVFVPTIKKLCSVQGVDVHPLYTNSQKYVPTNECVVTAEAQNIVTNFFMRNIPADCGQTWDDYTAINGDGQTQAVVMSTSTGFLSKYFKDGKKELFDAEEQKVADDGSLLPMTYVFSDVAKNRVVNTFNNRSFCDQVKFCENELRAGRALQTFWVSTLKDELRENKKILLGKTRVFEQPSFEYAFLVRKFFGSFLSWFRSCAGFKLMHGIGNDKETVWKHYWEVLNRWNGKGFDLDFTNYDGTVQVAAFDFFLSITDKFYGDNDRVARHTLIHSLCNSLHVVGTDLCESYQGNKSGNPMTDAFNSITNVWFILMCYLSANVTAGKGMNVDDFYDNVRAITYGDDVIASVSERMAPYFNRESCARVGKALGMVVTSAAKDGVIVPVEDLSKLTFLKSPFVVCNDVVVAPLPMKVIHRIMMWQHKANVGDVDVFKQRVRETCDLVAHHGRDAYLLYLKQLKECGIDEPDRYNEWLARVKEKQALCELTDVDVVNDVMPVSNVVSVRIVPVDYGD